MVYRRQPNDCVVTALANYTGHTYDEVHALLEQLRASDEGNGNGYWRDTYLFALTCLLGRALHAVPSIPMNGIVRFNDITSDMGHIVAVRDGMIWDGSLVDKAPMTPEQYTQAHGELVMSESWE